MHTLLTVPIQQRRRFTQRQNHPLYRISSQKPERLHTSISVYQHVAWRGIDVYRFRYHQHRMVLTLRRQRRHQPRLVSRKLYPKPVVTHPYLVKFQLHHQVPPEKSRNPHYGDGPLPPISSRGPITPTLPISPLVSIGWRPTKSRTAPKSSLAISSMNTYTSRPTASRAASSSIPRSGSPPTPIPPSHDSRIRRPRRRPSRS